MTRVLIMAGGTGGHVFPALAVAQVLRARQCDVRWVGTKTGIEARLVPEAGIPIDWIAVGGLRGKGLARLALSPFVLLRALYQVVGVLRRQRPDVVLGLGGFVSGPGGVAARLLRLPLVIHEQNAIAGMTNRILSRVATRVAQAFPGSFGAAIEAVTVGNPVRSQIEAISGRVRESHPGKTRLLVFGGSLGAQALNRAVPAALARLPESVRPEVLHQTGRGRTAEVQESYQQAGVKADVREFIDDMAAAYTWADLAICRSGALTVTELAAAGLPSILVPYPHAVDDHQTANASYLVSRGAARLIQEPQLTADGLATVLAELTATNDGTLARMRDAARSAAVPGAAERLAGLCLSAAEAHT